MNNIFNLNMVSTFINKCTFIFFRKNRKKNNNFLKTLLFLFFLLLNVFIALPARAEDGHSAKLHSMSSGDIYIYPGKAITFEIKFENTGTATWQNYGENYTELVTNDPVLRDSDFKHKFWPKDYLLAKLLEKEVNPGEIGTFRFALQAPEKEGFYLEKLLIVARRRAWIENGEVELPIYVYKENPFKKKNEDNNNKNIGDNTKNENEQNENITIPKKNKGHAANLLIKSEDVIILPVNTLKEIKLGYKNIGEHKWSNSGNRFASLYTIEPKYHNSRFYDSNTWYKENQIKLSTDEVKPGEIGYFNFKIRAGSMVGEFEENFRLAVEDYAWVYNSDTKLNIKVVSQEEYDNLMKKNEENNNTNNGNDDNKDDNKEEEKEEPKKVLDYEASLLIHSGYDLVLNKGEMITYRLGFKNIGKEDWYQTGRHFVSLYTVLPNYHDSLFSPNNKNGTTWLNSHQIKMDEEKVASGVLGYFTLTLRAPNEVGRYVENFKLAAENKAWIKGGDVSFNINVVENKNDYHDNGSTGANKNLQMEEPLMRIGLFRPDEPMQISANGKFSLVVNENVVKEFTSGQIVTVSYENSNYIAKYDKQTYTSADYLRLVPKYPEVIMKLVNYEDRPSWNKSYNDNRFRGIIELRYNDHKKRTWLINELMMDEYLKGLIETSNYDPIEYLKTMSIAARTYALYHYNQRDKHEKEFFIVDAYYDQVYHGYSAEQRLPRLAQAVDETKGIIITYDGKVVITPYYAHSDGRTRDWTEVFGGEAKPWLVSVPDPYNKGRNMFGHGVGLSARGALMMAREEDKKYDDIIKYYYTGVGIETYY